MCDRPLINDEWNTVTDLSGKRILVIGARSGIGQAIARAVVDAGGTAILGSRDAASAVELASTIGSDAVGVAIDLSLEASIEAAAAELGRIDAIVTVAADHANGPVAALDASDVEKALGTPQ